MHASTTVQCSDIVITRLLRSLWLFSSKRTSHFLEIKVKSHKNSDKKRLDSDRALNSGPSLKHYFLTVTLDMFRCHGLRFFLCQTKTLDTHALVSSTKKLSNTQGYALPSELSCWHPYRRSATSWCWTTSWTSPLRGGVNLVGIGCPVSG